MRTACSLVNTAEAAPSDAGCNMARHSREMMKKCFAVDLRDDPAAIAQYERMHRPGAVWPEVIADLRAQGYVEITTWRAGNRIFMLTECEPVASPPTWDRQTQAILDRWDAVMAELQQALTGHDEPPRWVEMTRVFDLHEHAENTVGSGEEPRRYHDSTA